MPHRFSWDWTKSFLGHIEYLAEFSRGTEYCWPFLRRFAPPIFIFVFFARLSRYGTSSVLFIFCSSSFLRFMGTFFCFLSFSFPRFFFGFFFLRRRGESRFGSWSRSGCILPPIFSAVLFSDKKMLFFVTMLAFYFWQRKCSASVVHTITENVVRTKF